MYVRVFAAAWLLACAGLALLAWGFEAPFAYDPVGPRAYPLLLLLLMACGAAWLLFKPHGEPTPPFDRPKARRAVLCVLALLAYALLCETLDRPAPDRAALEHRTTSCEEVLGSAPLVESFASALHQMLTDVLGVHPVPLSNPLPTHSVAA